MCCCYINSAKSDVIFGNLNLCVVNLRPCGLVQMLSCQEGQKQEGEVDGEGVAEPGRPASSRDGRPASSPDGQPAHPDASRDLQSRLPGPIQACLLGLN